MIETPYDLDAVRALDDIRLTQFLELVYTFGPRVANEWLLMCCGWRNEANPAINRNPRLEPGETETFQAAAWGKQSTGTYRTPVFAQHPAPRKRSTVH